MKTAIVAEGGATRAYFSVGVMDALIKYNIYPDYFIGVSAGIANGVSYLSRQFGRNLEIGIKYCCRKEYMGFKHLLFSGNYYNVDYVFHKIPDELLPFDYDAYRNFKGEIYCAATNLKTGKCEYFNINDTSSNWNELLASCALPILFKPVEINGNIYMDGGITNSIPYKKALDDGCDRVLVLLTRDRKYVKKPDFSTKLAAYKFRKYTEFSDALLKRDEMYNTQRMELFELESQGKVKIICPTDTSDWKRIDKSAEFVNKIYKLGYNCALQNIKQIQEYMN